MHHSWKSLAYCLTLQWGHNEGVGVSNELCPDCLLNRLFSRRSKKTSKLRVTGLCEGNPPVTGGFPSQGASNVEDVSIWWRHHQTWPELDSWQAIHHTLSFRFLFSLAGCRIISLQCDNTTATSWNKDIGSTYEQIILSLDTQLNVNAVSHGVY